MKEVGLTNEGWPLRVPLSMTVIITIIQGIGLVNGLTSQHSSAGMCAEQTGARAWRVVWG